MKKIKYLTGVLLLSVIVISCTKYPEPDSPVGFGLPPVYTNYYVLEKIWGTVKKDTIMYNNYYIEIYFAGYLIVENTYYSTQSCSDNPNPYCALPIEQKYFINKIGNIKIETNNPYKNNTREITDMQLFVKDNDGNYTGIEKGYYGKELGYSPLKIYLTESPDSSQWYTFTINITDDRNNVFTCKTDSVYIIK